MLPDPIAKLLAWRSVIIAFAAPIVFLPLCFNFSHDEQLEKSMRCAYTILVMVTLWTTEAIPLPVTALVPMVLYPMLEIVTAKELAPKYMSETNLAFMGTIMVIVAFERVELPKRLALKVLTLVGAKPRWLVAGFMLVSWFLSMWTSNTMSTILLTPIVLSVTAELRKAMSLAMQEEDETKLMMLPSSPIEESPRTSVSDDEKHVIFASEASHEMVKRELEADFKQDCLQRKYENMLLLSIAYSASIGGTGTVIGSPPNLIMKEQLEIVFTNHGCTSPINFLSWMIFSIPMSFTFLIIMWIWLLIFYTGPAYAFGLVRSPLDKHRHKVELTIKRIKDGEPPMSFLQIVVLFHAIFMVLLMVTRQITTNPLFGWELVAPGYVKESTASYLVAILLFMFPVSLPFRDKTSGKMKPAGNAVTWKEIERNFPLGVILLIGGGMAAAYGADKSGLASLLAGLLSDVIKNFGDKLSVFIIIICIVYATEVMSNTACVTLMMPILSELAQLRGSNPMLYMFPTALASSFAFMFPVATPPNAIIFQTGNFRIIDMIMAGFVVNVIGIVIVYVSTMTYGASYFGLFEMPWQFANSTNMTTLAPNSYICM